MLDKNTTNYNQYDIHNFDDSPYGWWFPRGFAV